VASVSSGVAPCCWVSSTIVVAIAERKISPASCTWPIANGLKPHFGHSQKKEGKDKGKTTPQKNEWKSAPINSGKTSSVAKVDQALCQDGGSVGGSERAETEQDDVNASFRKLYIELFAVKQAWWTMLLKVTSFVSTDR